jgi:predicted RNA-binding protein with PIN domain
MKKQLMIVDGYNVIGAWPELNKLKKQDKLDAARDILLEELSNYAKFQNIELLLVFDAMFVPGVTQSYKKYNLIVIFTKEGETAVSYIERLAGKCNDVLTQVTVVTSDLAEQWTIFGQGALRMSSRELYKSVETAKKNISGIRNEIELQGMRRNSPWTDDQLNQLNALLFNDK